MNGRKQIATLVSKLDFESVEGWDAIKSVSKRFPFAWAGKCLKVTNYDFMCYFAENLWIPVPKGGFKSEEEAWRWFNGFFWSRNGSKEYPFLRKEFRKYQRDRYYGKHG